MSICVFGASITHGEYDTQNGGWVEILRKHFDNSDQDLTVYNLGVSGNTTEDLLKRLEVEASARKPSLILISIGNNDSSFRNDWGKNWVSEDVFAQNIAKIHSIAARIADKVVFFGLTPIDDSKTTPFAEHPENTYTDQVGIAYSSIIEAYCHDHHIPFYPLHNVITNNDLFDGLHPTTEGHKKLFDYIQPIVEQLVVKPLK